MQTPFWFKTLPKLMPMFFENGEKDPSRAWLEFGPIQNRKYANNYIILNLNTKLVVRLHIYYVNINQNV